MKSNRTSGQNTAAVIATRRIVIPTSRRMPRPY
jgi:hypothetical protein